MDKGIPPQSDTASVSMVVTGDNQFAPVFNSLSYQVIVPENEPLGTVILYINATDEDSGPNGLLRYEIAAGNNRADFGIDAVSGAVSILRPLDFDTINRYELSVVARDLGFESKRASAVLVITLTDVNDNSPEFERMVYEAFLKENRPEGELLCQVMAKDRDSPRNAIIVYSIAEGMLSQRMFFVCRLFTLKHIINKKLKR